MCWLRRPAQPPGCPAASSHSLPPLPPPATPAGRRQVVPLLPAPARLLGALRRRPLHLPGQRHRRPPAAQPVLARPEGRVGRRRRARTAGAGPAQAGRCGPAASSLCSAAGVCGSAWRLQKAALKLGILLAADAVQSLASYVHRALPPNPHPLTSSTRHLTGPQPCRPAGCG